MRDRRTTEEIRQTSLFVAVDTPFTQKGDVDHTAFDTLVRALINGGVEGIIVGGTTGCGHLLSWEEHLELIRHAVMTFRDELVIVGNTGSNSTRESLHATRQGFEAGMCASLLIGPYYGKTSREGTFQHLMPCLEMGPGIIYNVPSRGHTDILPETMARLAEDPNFLGSKECMGIDRIRELTEMGIGAWSGNDDEAFVSRHQAGALGVISVAGNIVPRLMRERMNEPRGSTGDTTLEHLFGWLFPKGHPNPISLKTLLPMLNQGTLNIRLPYVPLPFGMRQQMAEILTRVAETFGWQHVVGHPTEIKTLVDTDYNVIV